MSANRLKLNTDKTELLWVGTRHNLSQYGPFPASQLGPDSIITSDHVRLLGATITSDLNLDRHFSVISASCFKWLRQLRRTWRSLDQESAATLAFVTSRVDYFNTLLAGAPKVTTDELQRVLNAAACVLTESGTHKFNRVLSRLLHTELHWLDIPERVTHKLGVIMFCCQHGRAPQCLIDYCLPVSDVASQQHLRSAVDVFWSYRVTDSARTAAGLLLWLARRSGTLSRTISVIQMLLQTTSSRC